MLGRREVPAREEDDLVVEERLADGAQPLGVERVVEVDVADLGADRAREGAISSSREVAVGMGLFGADRDGDGIG